MQDPSADVTWDANGVPFSNRFDDPYFSLENGLEETRHVFLHGNGLPERFCDGFHVAELGFGTGLNFLATVLAWRASGVSGRLRFTSFEAFPLSAEQIEQALAVFPELTGLRSQLVACWEPVGGVFNLDDDVELNVIKGDASPALNGWGGLANAWYLDGFSPAKNPDLWSDTILDQVARHTAAEGTFATYTAAGFVRRSLERAGFAVTRSKGFGRKRHMSQGVLRP
ncbi:tRNA 5-methylaminomethyl-2-thiouridine biosynthesis bifunctional protein MnmC [Roseobacter fucihabitans]|uniref:tRNA 5-methylaminomethyl-2-thiouridine biosynthesis bifunctional protein MnmC n=1 Tax=Roseobacter fucihabitans TaxID=1537242 RepID=A0ABZ2C0H5_9RHOB|nr:tRNA (5-methylaminomethyl-2-thiouridine)(34)-methyltransferase MnmD [Roseobacter litoralis]MBC6964950.1 tRNA 5-methylaminomethyl-2-thiouridine biosynthesis bifunctional protein MnmC [Roseobacter litoralis]